MIAQEQQTLRTVILHSEVVDASGLAAYRLLNDLGHEVSTTESAKQALEMLQSDHADLVVVDADQSEQTEFMSRLTSLPADQQPTQVAIFSDDIDDRLATLGRGLQRAKVHLLLRPLHMHGLLGVLRNIEAKA